MNDDPPVPDRAQNWEQYRRTQSEREAREAAALQVDALGQAQGVRVGRLGSIPVPFMGPPITEGSPPAGLVPPPGMGPPADLVPFLRAQQETAERQARVVAARMAARPTNPADTEAEQARQALGAALAQAVESGLVSEEQALAMITAGNLNDQPMQPAEARVQVLRALGQAVRSEALARPLIEQILSQIDGATPPESIRRPVPRPTDAAPPSAGQIEAEEDPARRLLLETASRAAPVSGRLVSEADLVTVIQAVPELIASINRLEALIYAALTIYPCHESEHDRYHAAASLPCAYQAASIGLGVIGGLVLPMQALPRDAHRNPDGTRAVCCANDGRVGTWLIYGQTIDPSL